MFFVLAVGSLSAVAPPEPMAVPQRSQYLQASFERAVGPATLWYAGWLSAFGTGFGIRTTLAFASSDPGVRLDSRVGMLTLGTGLVVTLVFTPRSLFAARRFRAIPANTEAEQLEKLRIGEELLGEAVLWERLGTSLIPHVAGIGVNLAAGLYLGLAAQRWDSGLVAVVGGVAVTELKIFTQPLTLSRAKTDYERRLTRAEGSRFAAPSAARGEGARVTLMVGASGIWIAGTF
jgi:hypothetical protein